MIKLKNILLEDRLEAMKDRLKLSDDDVIYLKSLNVPSKYIIWLANQYKLNTKQHGSNERFKEDVYKYEEALQKFFELSTKNKIEDKNINNYKDIFALYDVIEQFDDTKSKREIEKDIKLKGAEKVYEDDKWLVVIPRTKEAACYYGKGTKWCTASIKTKNWFDDYNSRGNLYIFINKKDSNERYQLHIEDDQFMDIQDQDYNADKFKSDNPELEHVFDIAIKNGIKNFIKKLKYNKKTGRYDSDHSINLRKYLIKNGKMLISFGEIKGDFNCEYNNLETLEGAPHSVSGDFKCSINNLETLEGAPHSVSGDFNCYGNNLKILEGAPHTIGGSFNCSNNKLETLEGAPHTVGGSFYCINNNLTTLEGAPHTVGSSFYCYNNKLKTLKGAPQTIGSSFYCYNNNLTTLEGAPKIVPGNFDCNNNKLETLDGAPYIVGGSFYCGNNQIKFTIDDVKKVYNVKGKINT